MTWEGHCSCYYCRQVTSDLAEIDNCLQQEFYARARVVLDRLRRRMLVLHVKAKTEPRIHTSCGCGCSDRP